ncbi:MAG TPA: GNAT family protein [Pyrinomonadaceae bacterium]|nr:GNAT family protein [Pyrinomonadaceae bacterium]
MTLEPLTLEGSRVRLAPLTFEHEEALIRAASDGELWNLNYTIVPSPTSMHGYIEKALQSQSVGLEHPFVIVDREADKIVGSTRYASIDLTYRKREIGYTWLARSAQRTNINTEAKYLLLTHAFENLNCVRVEFVTDVLNERSRAALARIGAKEEGILRNHMIMPGGRYRDSVSFSIIESEWPEVKAGLEQKLKALR